jgi:hypothetical protein
MIEGNENFHPDKGADGKDFAMGEVDKLKYAIDHGVAKGDGGVDKADGQSVENHLREVDQGVGVQGNVEFILKCLTNDGLVENKRQYQHEC